MLSDGEWNALLDVAQNRGELLFLNGKRSSFETLPTIEGREQVVAVKGYHHYEATEQCFRIFCETYPQSKCCEYFCYVRPFSCKSQNFKEYWNNCHLNLMCIDAKNVY